MRSILLLKKVLSLKKIKILKIHVSPFIILRIVHDLLKDDINDAIKKM